MRNFRNVLAAVGFGAWMLISPVWANEGTDTKQGCTGFKFNLDRELQLFASKPHPVTANAVWRQAAAVQTDTLYKVALAPQSEVKFASEPGKLTVNDGSYAGSLSFTPARDGVLRITLDEPAWLDVVVGGVAIQSSSHTGSAACKLLHKSVQFAVKQGAPVAVQISGSTVQEVRLTLTQP